MEILIKTADLRDALTTIQILTAKSVVSSTGIDCLLIAGDDGITMEAAAQGIYVKQELDGDVKTTGEVLLNNSYLSGLKLSGKSTVIKHLPGKKAYLKCGGLTVEELATGQDPEKVKLQRPAKVDIDVTIPSKMLTEGTKLVAFSPTSTSQNLSAKILVGDEKFCIYTSDYSYRGAIYKRSFETDDVEFSVVLPLAFMSAMVRRIATKDVELGTNEKAFKIVAGKLEVHHPTKQTKFPDIDQFITKLSPKKKKVDIEFDATEASNSVGEVSSIVMGTLGLDVRLSMLLGDKEIDINVKSSIGKTHSKFAAVINDDKSKELTLSTKYLLDFLRLVSKGTVNLKSWDELIVMKGASHEYLVYIMPTVIV
jgi:DNA polymerase III sliding clamp (beta) subunit (PCNA family)